MTPHRDRPWEGYIIGCHNGSWYGNYGGVRTADGSTPLGEYNVGGGLGGGRSINTEEAEQGHSVHCDTTNSETL